MLRAATLITICLLLAACASKSTATDSDRIADTPPARIAESQPAPPPEEPAVAKPMVTFSLLSDQLPTDGMWKCDPVFADLNADGHIDLAAIPRLGKGARVWLGDGQGGWSEASSGLQMSGNSCGGGIDVGDINGDGHVDLAVADHCRGIFIYLGDGKGNWVAAVEAMHPGELSPSEGRVNMYQGTEDISMADVNGDGFLDIVVSASDEGGINLYLGDGTGTGWVRSDCNLPTTGWGNRVQFQDMNADGLPDIVATHSDGPRVWLNDGEGDWLDAWDGLPSPMLRGVHHGLAIGDYNNDGRLDIGVANWVDGPEVYFQEADGSWRKAADVFPKMLGGAIGMACGDLDRDGNLDIITAGRLDRAGGFVRGIFYLRGRGDETWEYVEDVGLPGDGLAAVAGVTLGDLDKDGDLDVALGTGLIVESPYGDDPSPRTKPIIPQRLPVWRTDSP